MTNQIAIVFGAVLVLAALADVIMNGGAAILFLMAKLIEVVNTMAFWR